MQASKEASKPASNPASQRILCTYVFIYPYHSQSPYNPLGLPILKKQVLSFDRCPRSLSSLALAGFCQQERNYDHEADAREMH